MTHLSEAFAFYRDNQDAFLFWSIPAIMGLMAFAAIAISIIDDYRWWRRYYAAKRESDQ